MNVGEILNYINELAPWKYAGEWDNVGLMLGSRTCEVKKIMICMDVTSKVIGEAIDVAANLIVSHHPFLFSKLNSVDLDTMKGKQISILIKNDISVISAHTNLDVAVGGVNDTLDMGLGKVGELSARLCFEEFIIMVKKNLDIDNLRIIGEQSKIVKKVAVFCGSFDVDLDIIKRHDVDVLITGDMKYHTALDAREMGLCILDVGHFASEHLIVNKLKKALENRFSNIEIVCSTLEKDPFIFA